LTWQEKLETLPNITLADIRDHYRRTHTAENMRFVVAGNFFGQETRLKKVLSSFNLPQGERMSVPVDDIHSFESFAVRRKDISNITFGLTINMPRRLSDAESTAMSCMDHILNGTLHGLILGEARKRGLTYDVWSNTGRYEHNSAWDFGGDVNIEKIDELFGLIVAVLRQIKTGELDDKLLDATKLYAMGRHQMGNQTVGQLANWYGKRYFFDGFVDDFDDSIKRIETVTKEQIIATVREFFDANTWGLGLYGSTDKATAERMHTKLEELFCD
jgi:predicted Zn-dependent peptidase